MTNLRKIERDDSDDEDLKRDGFVRNGESIRVDMRFMDSVQRAVAASGVRFGTGIIDAARCDEAYRAYDEKVSNSWRDSRPAIKTEVKTEIKTEVIRAAPGAPALDHYQLYDARISRAWMAS